MSIFDLPSDPAAFDALAGAGSALPNTVSSVMASEQASSSGLAAFYSAVADKGYGVAPLTDAAETETDSARLLALLRQDMAAFGAGAGLDSQAWKGLAMRAFEFM